MSNSYDVTAMSALSDALSDAADIHRSAAAAARDAAIERALSGKAAMLENLCRHMRIEGDEPGTVLKHLERLKLAVDTWFGDDDDAAETASREAIGHLLHLINQYLDGAEISPALAASLIEIRGRLHAPGISTDQGGRLADLPI